jgi:hypothetical protein
VILTFRREKAARQLLSASDVNWLMAACEGL